MFEASLDVWDVCRVRRLVGVTTGLEARGNGGFHDCRDSSLVRFSQEGNKRRDRETKQIKGCKQMSFVFVPLG